MPQAARRDADDRAVREVVRHYVDAREARDPKAVAALFTADADQLVSSGEWRSGTGHRRVGEPGVDRAERREADDRRRAGAVRRPTDVAIADGRYSITGLGEGNDRRMWSTFVMVKEADGWKIAAIRNMLPAAPVGAK